MTEASLLELLNNALVVTLLVAGPPLGVALLVGLAVSLFQAVTQINEMTLTFVPKMLALVGVVVMLGPWMLGTLLDYTAALFIQVAELPR